MFHFLRLETIIESLVCEESSSILKTIFLHEQTLHSFEDMHVGHLDS